MLELNPNITQIIDRDNAKKFYQALELAFSCMSYEQLQEAYLYVYNRKAIAISFDKDWQPFIGYTSGYNELDDRTPLNGGGEIIKLAQDYLKELHKTIKRVIPEEPRGGRIFIEPNCVYRFTHDTEELLFWCFWLGDSENETNPVRYTLQSLEYYRNRKNSRLNYLFS